MKFRTEYEARRCPGVLTDYEREIVLMGSCFADNIGARLLFSGWKAEVNPCGVLYNPASIARTLCNVMDSGYEPELCLHPATNVNFSFDFSTKFSDTVPQMAVAKMMDGVLKLRKALCRAQALFITFGTSWVFELADTYQVVANCHKLAGSIFRRRCMDVAEMEALWQPLVADLQAANSNLRIVFTVSPVRHLADGFEGNARSKARLLLLCEKLAELPGCHYFPAYEILNDDLRDYRFYADDLTHPSEFAADYIFARFTDTFIPASILPVMDAARRERRRAAHRPIQQ